MRAVCLTTGRMPRGFAIYRAYLPTDVPHLHLPKQAAALRAAVARYQAFKGPSPNTPSSAR